MSIDLRRVRHFVALAETLNFRRAAQRLHIAQPALSVSIQKLEHALGARLFVRQSTGVALSEAGVAALAEARRTLVHADAFAQAARTAGAGHVGTLRVGFVGSVAFTLLQRLVPRYRQLYPQVDLRLREATSAQVLELLDEDALDIGLVRTPVLRASRAALAPLLSEPLVAAMPDGHRLARRRSLSLSDFSDEGFVLYTEEGAAGLRSAVLLACQRAGFLPRIAQEATQVQTVLALVQGGLGVALVPDVGRNWGGGGVCFKALTDPALRDAVGLALAAIPEQAAIAGSSFRALALEAFARPDLPPRHRSKA